MKSFAQIRQETTTVQLEFLLTDIATAHTFLDVAKTTRDAATRTRNVQHARVAYKDTLRFSGHLSISSDKAADLQNRLDRLKERIDSAEQR